MRFTVELNDQTITIPQELLELATPTQIQGRVFFEFRDRFNAIKLARVLNAEVIAQTYPETLS